MKKQTVHYFDLDFCLISHGFKMVLTVSTLVGGRVFCESVLNGNIKTSCDTSL